LAVNFDVIFLTIPGEVIIFDTQCFETKKNIIKHIFVCYFLLSNCQFLEIIFNRKFFLHGKCRMDCDFEAISLVLVKIATRGKCR